MRNYSKYLISLLIFLAGFLASWWYFNYYQAHRQAVAETEQIRHQGNYKFINPLYECEVNGDTYLKKYIPFEDKIKERITGEVQSNHDIQLAVYFRNLNNGPWFGINENMDFAPASLLKVPLMIAYLKKSETDSNVLNENIVFKKEEESNLNTMQQVTPQISLKEGETYTVEELIRRMIIYSDNEAMAILTNRFSKDDLYQIYTDLGVNNPYKETSADVSDVISVKDYASFFRILYNAAYLNQADSEKALGLLAQSNFQNGLVAGIPDSIALAHKFGERELDKGQYPEQFHDCGIAYYEKYPYLLCVMTRGNDKGKLIQAIADVSHIVFEEISRNYP